MKTNPIKALYKRLGSIDMKEKYVRDYVLPAWWEDGIAETPSGYAEALGIISDTLSIDLRSLQDPNGILECRPFLSTRNKARQSHKEIDCVLARGIAVRAAQLSHSALLAKPRTVPGTALQIRNELLNKSAVVDFETLLEYSWSMGIAVLYVKEFPVDNKLFGMAARLGVRYAILLSKKSPYSAWQLFILAHELGHIALGHLPENGVLIDDQSSWKSTDSEEEQANEFAIELLTGDRNTKYRLKTTPKQAQLADLAKSEGERFHVDAGIVALNYIFNLESTKNFWGLAIATLKLIEPNANAFELIHSKMRLNLDWDALSEDDREFLLRVTGGEARV